MGDDEVGDAMALLLLFVRETDDGVEWKLRRK